MRTTLNIDDLLIREAKKKAAETGKTLTAVIEDALRHELAGETVAAAAFSLEFPTVKGTRLPMVDVADRDALLNFMENPE
jgi:hypothetical protein